MKYQPKNVLGVLAVFASLAATPALAQGTLRIGMTASDVPLTTGQTDQGGEGMRFMGYPILRETRCDCASTAAGAPTALSSPAIAVRRSIIQSPRGRGRWFRPTRR